MFEYYLEVWRKYAVFSGRARRAEYWYFQLTNFLIVIVAQMVMGFVSFTDGGADMLGMFGLVYFLYNVALLVPSIAAGVRRLHDSNKSGWWLLVPFYNLYLLIRRGTDGENYYGPDPKAPVMDVPPAPPAAIPATPTT